MRTRKAKRTTTTATASDMRILMSNVRPMLAEFFQRGPFRKLSNLAVFSNSYNFITELLYLSLFSRL